MSRDPDHPPDHLDPSPPSPGPPDPRERMRTTRPGTVVAVALAGLVLGWLVRAVAVRVTGSAPTVSWLPAVSLLFVAVVVGWVAWSTYRVLHRRREQMEPQHAVNRLVLAKACAVAGALFGGGYLGYALSWLGLTDALLARQRVEHSLVAAGAGALLVVGALLLERACRVDETDH